MVELAPRLAELQERLYEQSTAGHQRSALLILQGMDTAGKDGVIGSAWGSSIPMECISRHSRSRPRKNWPTTSWRIEKQVPEPGFIGVFNRSAN